MPFLARKHFHQVTFDRLRRIGGSETEPGRHAFHMRVHDNSLGLRERVVQHDVRRLPGNSWKQRQLLHRVGNFSAMLVHQSGGHSPDVPGLVPVETGRMDETLELFLVRPCVLLGRPVAPEQIRCHLVHPFIGALGTENRRHQQFEWAVPPETDLEIRVEFGQARSESG